MITNATTLEQGFVRSLQSNDLESLKRLLLDSSQLEMLKTSVISLGSSDSLPLLHLGVLHGSVQFVDTMLRFGFDPNTKTPKGKKETCISMLVRIAESGEKQLAASPLEMIQLLLENGASPTIPDVLLWKPIHATQNKKIIKLLLRYGESIDSLGGATGCTPLILACRKGNKELVSWLLKHHANPNICDKQGFFPIHHALGDEHVVRLLLEQGKQCINKRANNPEGYTPLHFCCERETKGIQGKSNLLILFGANPDLRTLTSNKTAEEITENHKYLFKLYRSRQSLTENHQHAVNTSECADDGSVSDEEEFQIIREQFNKYMINYNYMDNLTRGEKRLSITHLILENYMD
nr:unnamed protein product [Naegleria fowleri]